MKKSKKLNFILNLRASLTLAFSAVFLTAGMFGGNVGFMQSLQIKTSVFDKQQAVNSNANNQYVEPTDSGIPPPMLGNYPNAAVQLGANTTITPDAAPTNATSISATTNSNFKGTLSVNITTGVVRVTNASVAGSYLVTLKAFGSGGTITQTFTLTVTNGTVCNGTVQFTNGTDITTGTQPVFTAIGDFNNDGIQDLAIGNESSSPISIHLGNGSGGFTTAAPVANAASGVVSITVGDFNKDGNLDLAATRPDLNAITIYPGNGAGGFSADVSYTTATSRPVSIATGDFNKDGNLDLVYADINNNRIFVRLGTGSSGLASFGNAVFVSVGTSPRFINLGDFNNDGNLDFATTNRDSNNVSIRLGDGAGGFSGTTNVSVGTSPLGLTVGDFNNDGNQDFAAANNTANTVSVRIGDGTGGFTNAADVSTGTNPFEVAVGDFNNDGNQDLGVTNVNSDSVSIRLGDGSGSFTGTTNVSVGDAPLGLAIGDFNADGIQDFTTPNNNVTTASIRLGSCSIVPTPTPTPTPAPTGIMVTNTNDSGAGSLRQAIADANAAAGADTIVFDSSFNTPQTITLAGTTLLIEAVDNAAVTITGPGANLLTISGNNLSRVFTIAPDDNASISGMTVTGGNAGSDFGGGLNNNGGTLTITNLIVTGNTATNGGGGVVTVGDLTIINCIITNNSAGAGATTGRIGGGGIGLRVFGSITMSGSTVSNNTSAAFGGGITASSNSPITINITDSTISNNSATGDFGGGGLSLGATTTSTITGTTISGNSATDPNTGSSGGIGNNGSFTLTNSIITGNTAAVIGGGITNQSDFSNTISGSTISNNIADSDNNNSGDGGGIHTNLQTGNNPTATLSVTNSTISGNTVRGSSRRGGGIYSIAALNVTNSTISGNSSGGNFGGIYDDNPGGTNDIVAIVNSTIVNNTANGNVGGYGVNVSDAGEGSIRNSIVANNTANGGSSPDINGPITSNGYNLFEDTTGATITGDTVTNITGQDPMLDVLANYGGDTETHKLMMGSPAIDAADPANFPPTDQRGVIRPIDGNPNNLVAQPDIGSFEAAAPTAANVVVSGRVTNENRGISRVSITLTDGQGNIRTARTNQFGYFRFADVAIGQTYIANISSKQYMFSPQVITVNEEITNLNFSPITQSPKQSNQKSVIRQESRQK